MLMRLSSHVVRPEGRPISLLSPAIVTENVHTLRSVVKPSDEKYILFTGS